MTKNVIYIALAMLLTACGNGEVVQFSTERMSITDSEVVLQADATSAYVGVDANCQWTAQLSGAWEHLTINPTQGGVNISSPVNTLPQHRSATLTITSQSGKLTKTLTVSQNAAGVSIEISASTLQFIGETDQTTVLVVSNADWQLSGDNEWCHASPATGTAGNTEVTISVDANPNDRSRSNPLVFSAGGGEARQTLTVSQAPPSTLRFATTESVIHATATAGTYQVSVTGTAEWTPMSDQPWLHITSPEGSVTGEGTVTIACDANTQQESRRATISLVWSRMASIPVQIAVEQAAATLPVVGATAVTGIDRTVATLTSSYTSAFPVTRHGFCYSTENTLPGLTDTVIASEGSNTSGEIRATLTDLQSGLRYHVRAFAQSAVGVSYGEAVSFNTSGSEPGADDNPMPNPR